MATPSGLFSPRPRESKPQQRVICGGASLLPGNTSAEKKGCRGHRRAPGNRPRKSPQRFPTDKDVGLSTPLPTHPRAFQSPWPHELKPSLYTARWTPRILGPNGKHWDTSGTSHPPAIPAVEQGYRQGREDTVSGDREGWGAAKRVKQGTKKPLLALFPKKPDRLKPTLQHLRLRARDEALTGKRLHPGTSQGNPGAGTMV